MFNRSRPSNPIYTGALHFRQFHRATRGELYRQVGLLLLGALAWLALYCVVAMRLWQAGFHLDDWWGLLLIFTCIALGITLFLGAYVVRNSLGIWWRSQRQRSNWSALSYEEMMALSPGEFEEYVTRRIFERHGYQVRNMPDVKDGGIDIWVTDEWGHQAIVQCKRYRNTVGEPTVRDLYGTMIHTGAVYAFIATTANISAAARKWATGKPIGLLDGDELVRLART